VSSTPDLARWRRDFRRWRRARPFWSGLLLIASGLELLLSANLDLGDIEVHLGFEGFLSYLLPVIMLLTGLFVWFTPKQRVFYGIIGALTAVYSLIGLNLGGWFIGMLLGLIGGGLAFAWTPVEPQPPSGPSDPSNSDASSASGDSWFDDTAVDEDRQPVVRSPRHAVDDDEPATGAPDGGGSSARWSFRFLAFVIPIAMLVVGLGTASVPSLAATTPRFPAGLPGGAPIPGIAPAEIAAVEPCPTATTPAATTPTASPSPTQPTLADLWRAFWEWVLGGRRGTPPPTPSGTPMPAPTCVPSDPGTSTATTPASPGTPASSGSTPASAGASVDPSASPAPLIAAAPGQPLVSARPAKLTTSLLTLEGFGFEGVVDLPTATGSIRALQFSITRATNADFRLLVEGDGHALEITSDPLIVSGSVKLYTSRFSGRLLGIPLTFTPDAPPPLTLPLMVFTDVSLDLVFLDCRALEAPSLTQIWLS
jgi:hypothetical protein